MDTPPVPTNTTPHQAFLALPRAWTRVGPALARSCIPEGSQITASKDKDSCPFGSRKCWTAVVTRSKSSKSDMYLFMCPEMWDTLNVAEYPIVLKDAFSETVGGNASVGDG